MTETKITRREFNAGAAAAAATVTLSSGALAQAAGGDFDLVILNGRVMDPETGFDQVANVGV